MEKVIPIRFSADLVGELIPTSDPELFTCKVGVFHKGLNRNGSFITDAFAESFAKSAFSKPVNGSYNVIIDDFKGHEKAQEVKAYGYVIPDSLQWLPLADDNGNVEDYATYDVIIWANYWPEARKIIGKGQSMEIDPATIQGDWCVIDEDGTEAFKYTSGVMACLTVLGDSHEPCFESSSFFSLDNEDYRKFSAAIKRLFSNGGTHVMNVKVAGVEFEKFATIWNTLNPNFTEENGYVIDEIPFSVGDGEFSTYACGGDKKVKKYTFSFDTVEGEEGEKFTYALESEVNYTEVDAQFTALQENFTAAAEEYNTEKATMTAQYEELKSQFDELQNKFTALEESSAAATAAAQEAQEQFAAQLAEKDAEIESYKVKAADADAEMAQCKHTISDYESKEKERVLQKFSKVLPAETIDAFSAKKDTLSLDELNTQLAIEHSTYSLSKEDDDKLLNFHAPQVPPENPVLYTILNKYKK